MNSKLSFSLLFLNIYISLAIYFIDVSGPGVLAEGIVSQICVLGLTFDFMTKNR